MEYFIGEKKNKQAPKNHFRVTKSLWRELVCSCKVPTWLVLPAWGAVIPIPPMEKSILSFDKSMVAAENHQFLWEGYFPVKMPARSGNSSASPASEESEKVKESLKAVWETQGKENASFQGRSRGTRNLLPCQAYFGGDASPVAGPAGKQNIWGEEWKKLIIYQRFDAFPQLPTREAEERPGNTEVWSFGSFQCPRFWQDGRSQMPTAAQRVTEAKPHLGAPKSCRLPAHAVVLNPTPQGEPKITSGLFSRPRLTLG